MSVRERIEQAESSLKAYPLWQRIFAYVALFVAIAYGAYTLFFADLIQEREHKQQEIASLRHQIIKYSPRRYERKLKNEKKALIQLRSALAHARDKEMQLRAKFHLHSLQLLNQSNLAKLLDDILFDSKRKNLVLDTIDILPVHLPFQGQLEVQKELLITGHGNFLDFVHFVRNIEAHPMLVKIEHMHIETNGTTPSFTLQVSLYGAKQ